MSKFAVGLLCALFVLSSCADSNSSKPSGAEGQVVSSSQVTGTESTSGSANESADAKVSDPLESSFRNLISAMRGKVGLAVAGEGGVKVFGDWAAGPAWSTIKVPLAIAGLRHSEESARPFVPLAIKDSDNDAAEAIWAQLGSPSEAAAAVKAVLEEGNDSTTVVQASRIRPKFTPFGQTIWPLAQQATFASSLPCLDRSQIVLTDMHHLAPNQRWALALRSDTAAKGGWGPSETGLYLVRQLAVIETPSGNLGVALSAEPDDGTLETGIELLNRLSEWVGNSLNGFKGRTC